MTEQFSKAHFFELSKRIKKETDVDVHSEEEMAIFAKENPAKFEELLLIVGDVKSISYQQDC